MYKCLWTNLNSRRLDLVTNVLHIRINLTQKDYLYVIYLYFYMLLVEYDLYFISIYIDKKINLIKRLMETILLTRVNHSRYFQIKFF